MMQVLEDVDATTRNQQNVVAYSIETSHEELHEETSISLGADMNSQSFSPNRASQGMNLCLELLPTTTTKFSSMHLSNEF